MVSIDDALIQSVVDGDGAAEQTLLAALAPRIEDIARAHPALRKRGLAAEPDELAEVRVAALERLLGDGRKNLVRYLTQRGDAGTAGTAFDSWLYGAVDFAIRDHLRKRFGRAPKIDPEAPKGAHPSKRDLGTLAGRFDEQRLDRGFVHTLGATTRLTASAIFEHVAQRFAPDEARAIRMYYLEDRSLAEIAGALGLEDARAAEKLIRRLNARLRYQFAREHDP